LTLDAVLDESVLKHGESVLKHSVGRPVVMHAQCEHLLRLAELPNLTLRVMPLPHGAHLGMNSAFAVLGFPEADDPDIPTSNASQVWHK
jgi:hypothetical protein